MERGTQKLPPAEYDPFTDRHLTDFYARKFGVTTPKPPPGVSIVKLIVIGKRVKQIICSAIWDYVNIEEEAEDNEKM